MDTTQRLTAREALQCDWITKASDATLEKNDMGTNLNELRKFNGKRMFRAAVASVIVLLVERGKDEKGYGTNNSEWVVLHAVPFLGDDVLNSDSK